MKTMKTPFILLPFIGLFAIFACKKDSHSPGVQAATSSAPKVKSATSTVGNTFNYSYDDAGRISRFDYLFNGKTVSWTTYTYTDTAVLASYQDTSSRPAMITVYKLGTRDGAMGRAISSYLQGNNMSNVFQYTYDSDGHLVSSTQTEKIPGYPDYSQTTMYYYSNGILDSMTRSDTRFGRVYFATYYDLYYTDQ
ncbi:MAG TPA: hypothetical protein VNU72_08250, partial [Puia sp.]|nr:hypothetical protein [Puia sp.]